MTSNLDGDAEDAVLHVIEPKAGEILNLKLAAATVPGPFGSRNPISPQLDGQRLTFVAVESEQGGVDLNGDGDRRPGHLLLRVKNGSLRPARSRRRAGAPRS